MERPSGLNFDKANYRWRGDADCRARPELYRVGKGEQGVLICEPYKSELTPLWRFKTPGSARRCANDQGGGRKYDPISKRSLEKRTGDPEKAVIASIFHKAGVRPRPRRITLE